MAGSKKHLSIIIPTFNNHDHVVPLFKSLAKSIRYLNKETEIIIVDNNSKDQTLNLVKKNHSNVIIIANNKNLGFSKAANSGLRKSSGEHILLLNPDIILSENVLQETLDFLVKHPQVGVITCKVLQTNGQIDLACHRGFPTPLASFAYFLGLDRLMSQNKSISAYHLLYKPLNTIHEIDSPSGAFYLTRRSVVEKTGLLDEKFFMYGEDLDWSYRIKKNGFKIIYYPRCYITHHKKQSGINSRNRNIQINTINAFYNAMKIFYRKHYLRDNPSIVNYAILQVIEIKRMWKILWLKN